MTSAVTNIARTSDLKITSRAGARRTPGLESLSKRTSGAVIVTVVATAATGVTVMEGLDWAERKLLKLPFAVMDNFSVFKELEFRRKFLGMERLGFEVFVKN